MSTLQLTLTRLTALARDTEADILSSVQLEFAGAILIIHWTGSHPGDLPREAHVFFGAGLDGIGGQQKDKFQCALVYDPERYLWAVEEELPDVAAEDYARRVVQSVEDLENYLLGKPYTFVQPEKKKSTRRKRS